MQNKKNPILAEIPPEEELVTLTLEPSTEQISRLCTLMHNGCYVKVECGKPCATSSADSSKFLLIM